MRLAVVAALVSLAALPLAAQAPATMPSDPDHKVTGGGMLPAGWHARADSPSADMSSVKFMTMGTGVHATLGPAAIFWQDGKTAKGNFSVSASFTQTKPAAHPEAYGLIVGGANLDGATQKYTYFVIRQDGKFLIKKRAGADTPTVMNWTDNAAVQKAGADGKMSNTLGVTVKGDNVLFLVNGTQVASLPKAQIDTDGVVGLRVNHNLDVHIDKFAVQSGVGS